MALNWQRVDLHQILGRSTFTLRVMGHWNTLPRVVVDGPSLDVFKDRLDGVLSKLIQWKVSLTMAEGLELDDLCGPFQPKKFFSFRGTFPLQLQEKRHLQKESNAIVITEGYCHSPLTYMLIQHGNRGITADISSQVAKGRPGGPGRLLQTFKTMNSKERTVVRSLKGARYLSKRINIHDHFIRNLPSWLSQCQPTIALQN